MDTWRHATLCRSVSVVRCAFDTRYVLVANWKCWLIQIQIHICRYKLTCTNSQIGCISYLKFPF